MTSIDSLPAGSVDILTLSAAQLSSLQSRLSQELEHLTTSYTRLRSAQARFRDCINSVKTGVAGQTEGT
jgi:prefoldin alpha subunit